MFHLEEEPKKTKKEKKANLMHKPAHIDDIKDKVGLSPLEKYTKYGKFPFKLTINLLIIIFIIVEFNQITTLSNEYDYSQKLWFFVHFLTPNVSTFF